LEKKVVINGFVLFPAQNPDHDLRLRIEVTFAYETLVVCVHVNDTSGLRGGVTQ
jgi:hypothetical protein